MAIDWNDTTGVAEAHERFLAGKPVGGAVRALILESWRRCESLGISAAAGPEVMPFSGDPDSGGILAEAARPVLDHLESRISGISAGVFLTDENAALLERRVGEPSMNRVFDAHQVAPGFAMPEQVVGTNGLGTALAARKPVLVRGSEHFADVLRSTTCAAVPIRDPLSGQAVGALDLSCLNRHAGPGMLPLAREAAQGIEQALLERVATRERALLQEYRQLSFAANALDEDRFEPHDRELLQHVAAELVASGRTAAQEVRLRRGQAVTLVGRPIETAGGVTGYTVEVIMPGGAPQLLDISRLSVAPFLDVSAPAGDASTEKPPPDPPSDRADRRLLVVGEPGVGQLALRARQRLDLLWEAGTRVGATLDVKRTAEELTEVTVPRFADIVAVDLPEAVLLGEEPVRTDGSLRRVAMSSFNGPDDMFEVGDQIRFVQGTPQARSLITEQPVREPVLADAAGWIAQAPVRANRLLQAGVHSLITVPVRARGEVLGVVSFYRSHRHPESFEDDDLHLAEELVGRAALCIDNARRFTREHSMALALQRSLLPRSLPARGAVQAAHRYLPARTGVGGDWFDVIPLPGTRVVLIVGDVVGHGLHAAASMGRLRTAVHNFAALDLAVDEVLTHLDDLVAGLDRDEDPTGTYGTGAIGASCVYAIYDPTTRRCTAGRAGHPPPALVLPDGTTQFLDLPAGPPLGLGGPLYEPAEIEIPDGATLLFYTDGLVEDRVRGLDLEPLRQALSHPGLTPEQMCESLVAQLLPTEPADDVVLLAARTLPLPSDKVASWDLPVDPAVVSRVRTEVTEQLAKWNLEELQLDTELMVSELVTNAIKHAGEPIRLRLIRDHASLVCEVSDGSSTSPRLRRARSTDEGGRGLFLIAELAQRWGHRYTTDGKVIWFEQPSSVSS